MKVKQIYGKLLMWITKIAGSNAAKKFDTKFRFQKKLNLTNPQTLADKVSYIELHDQSPLASLCTDKFAVRSYVESKGLAAILVPLVGGPWDLVAQIDFKEMPDRFVLKATHGCKMNYIVSDKSKLNEIECHKEMNRWMSTTYGTYSMEPHYWEIPHRIYAERFLENADQLTDYKFHCLNGIPQFVLVCSDRKADGDKAMKVTLDLFDMQWNHIPEIVSAGAEMPGDGSVKKPPQFDEMKKIAEILSEDFKFVRVDLYELHDRIYFGELTFSPGCCVFPYFTDKFNQEMGKKLIL